MYLKQIFDKLMITVLTLLAFTFLWGVSIVFAADGDIVREGKTAGTISATSISSTTYGSDDSVTDAELLRINTLSANAQIQFNAGLSPMVVTGGEITTGVAGTFTVAAVTALLRASNSLTGDLTYVTLAEQADQPVALTETTYFICLDYNGGAPQVVLSTTNPYIRSAAPDYTQIVLGKVLKQADDTIHYISGGFAFQDGVEKLHVRVKTLHNFTLASGSAIAYTPTNSFTMTTGQVFGGVNKYALAAYASTTTTFTTIRGDGAGGFTETSGSNAINYTQYDDGAGALANVGNHKYGNFWVYRHIDDGDVFVRYGVDSYSLAKAEAAQEPTKPTHLTDFGLLIGKIVAPKAGGSFKLIQMITDVVFSASAAADHGNLTGLADDDHTQYLRADGTRELTAAWNAGSHVISSETGLSVPSGFTATTAGAEALALTLGTALPVASGGIGATTLIDGGVLLGSGAGAVTALPQGTHGQLVIGETGGDPSVANITETGDVITITNGAASIDFSAHASLESIADLTETNGGLSYGTADNAYAWLAAGAEGTIFMGNGAGAPSFLAAGATTEILVGGGAADPVWTTATGTGAPVRANTPTLIAPVLGAATATSIAVADGFTASTAGAEAKALTVTGNVDATTFTGDGSALTGISGGPSIDAGDSSITIEDTGTGVATTIMDGVTVATVSAAGIAYTPSVTTIGTLSAATYGSDGSIADAELLYINTLSSNAQDQLDARALESVVGTSIGTGLTLDGTVLKTQVGLQSIAGLAETNGGISYGTADNAYAWLAAGTANYLLQGNGVGAPSWTNAPTVSAANMSSFPTLNQNTTGSAASCTGNAATATTLATTRAIYGNNFDGSVALTQIVASAYGGTGNGFAKFTGPTTAERTFTLPDSNATLIYSGGDGGTPSALVGTNISGTSASLNIGGTAANLSGTPALPDGTTATTQGSADNSTKIATTAYADAVAGGGASISEGDSSITVADAGTGVATTVMDGSTVATVSAAGIAYTPSVAVVGTLSAGLYGSDGSVTDAELLYINTLSSNAQTQLDARALESVVGTSIGTGLTLDGTVLKTQVGLQSIAGLSETNGGLAYGTADNAYAWLAAGTANYLLQGNGVGAPSWTNAPTVSAANMSSFPTLNQNTTGTAANVSGTPALPDGTTATTQGASDNSTKLATTAYADAAAGAGAVISAGDSSITVTDTGTGVATTIMDGATVATVSAAGIAYTPSIAVIGNISAATYGSDSSVTDAELLYINTLSSNAQTQLDVRALESVVGTSLGTGMLLDGAVLKASTILQKYHGVDPPVNTLSLLGAADYDAMVVLLKTAIESGIDTLVDLTSLSVPSGFTATTAGVEAAALTATGNIGAATYGSDSSVTDAELLYINTLSSNAQTQLNVRALESVVGTSLGTGLLLDGAVLKTSTILQKYHGVDPAVNTLSLLGAADYDAMVVLLKTAIESGIDTLVDLTSLSVPSGFTATTAGAEALSLTLGAALPVASGGSGATTLTSGGLLTGSDTDAITTLGEASNGQIPIGDGATDPVLATLTGTANEITIVNGAGSITISIPDSPIFVTPEIGVAEATSLTATGNIDATTFTGDGSALTGISGGAAISAGDSSETITDTGTGVATTVMDGATVATISAAGIAYTPSIAVVGTLSAGLYGSDGSVTDAELRYINTLSNNAQTQLDARALESVVGTSLDSSLYLDGVILTARAATTSLSGVVELTIASEINTGTSTTQAITPDSLAGSNFGKHTVESVSKYGYTTTVAIADDVGFFIVPTAFDGMNLVDVEATVVTPGVTNTMTIMIDQGGVDHTGTQDMLSTAMTIDTTEWSTRTAAAAAVIDAAQDDVSAGDFLIIKVTGIHTTPAKGLIIEMVFQLP